MKTIKKLTALLLVLIILAGVSAAGFSAAEIDIVPLTAYTGLEALGTDIPQSTALEASGTDLPSSYNSAQKGIVLPVREQNTNNCWAFGALSTMETLLLSMGEEISTFSPQHANFWGTTRADGTGWQRNEFSGGYSYIPLGYLTSWSGPVYESDLSLNATRNEYENLTATPGYGVTEAIYFNNDSDDAAIKELIYTYGSVMGNYNADTNYLSQGTSFYCSNSSLATNQLLGHCVSVVGWDDNYAKENFSDSISGTPAEDGAWLIKNSWGEYANALGGYYWISYEDVWMFDDIFGPSYVFTSVEKITEEHRIYQNEIDGATYECTYFTSKKNPYNAITYMNVYNFEEGNRTLDKVVFESTSLGADYTVYYIPMNGDIPSNDTSLWTKLAQGTIDYTGYICAEAEDTELPAGIGAIGITIDNTRTYLENKDKDGYTYIYNSIGVSEWLNSGGRRIFTPQSDYGMSYYMKNGVVEDIMTFYDKTWDDTIGGTFVIKAITKNPESIAKLNGYSLTLAGNIGMNFFINLSEETLSDENAKVVFTYADTTVEIPVSEGIPEENGYKFTCPIPAKEMTTQVNCQVVTSTQSSDVFTKSIKEYAEDMLANKEAYAKEAALVKAMLNYGAAAQSYFDYNTENLANNTDYMTDEDRALAVKDFSNQDYTLTQGNGDIIYYGSSLSLKSETAINHYFILKDTTDADSLSVTVDGTDATLTKNGDFYTLSIKDIPAQNLQKDYLVQVGDVSLSYSVTSYGNEAYNQGKDALVNVMYALSSYAESAQSYLNLFI